MSLRPAATRVFRPGRRDPQTLDNTWNASEDRLAIRQQLNDLQKLFYRFAQRFEHGIEMVKRVEGNHWKEWSEAMISCVQVEMECMMDDHILLSDTQRRDAGEQPFIQHYGFEECQR